ncbi:NAC domain-containing protein 41 [Spatholobus suberectus]|nr:NAC domain-containing protein 41 [Spatholobus suberectus]
MPCHCDSSKELKPVPCSPKAKVFGWVTLFEMEIVNEIKGKTYKLPVGYRFDPTDDILVGYYLRKKIVAQPLPNNLIQDCDVFQTEPWGLPGGGKHLNWQKFFFYDTRARVFENPDKRGAGNGEWHAVEKGQDVEFPSKQLVGKKNILVFWEASGNRFTKTNWVMHEFRLAPKSSPSQMSLLAVYRIFEMKEGRKGKKAKVSHEVASNSGNVGGAMEATPTVIDFTMDSGTVTGPPSPASPSTPSC